MTPAPGSNQERDERKELEVLLAVLVEIGLSAAQKARLREILKDNAEARLFYKRYLEVHAMLDWEAGTVATQQTDADVLQDLLRMESEAHAELVHDIGQLNSRFQMRQAAIWGGIAAVLAIAVIVTLVFNSGSAQPNATPPVAQQDEATDSNQSSPVAAAVATLTATHNAVWAQPSAERALARGSALYAGTRLTLTAGFAEITTHRGAIAILEAPCVVELKDNDNAIRLLSGKLVGICETESSKGFLVRTPHMDVIDLGTRFGVDASKPDATEVHVLEGEVELSRPAFGFEKATTALLTKGQAMRAEAVTKGFVLAQIDPTRFANRPGKLLAGTGQGQAAGEIANNWRVVAVDGQPITQHGGLILVPEHHDGTSDPNTSQWLMINDALNPPDKGSAVFTCRSSFQVPDRVDPKTYELVIRCEADFSVKAVRINGQSLSVPGNRIGNGWITLTSTDFALGQNTIEVDVHEYFSNNGKGNSSSLRVELQAHRR